MYIDSQFEYTRLRNYRFSFTQHLCYLKWLEHSGRVYIMIFGKTHVFFLGMQGVYWNQEKHISSLPLSRNYN